MAVAALVLLIVAHRHAEGDEAAAEPASNEAEDETEDPGEGALLLIDVCHAVLLAVLACDGHRVVWPVTGWVSTHDRLLHHDDWLHDGLAGNRSGLLGRILHLLSGLGSVAGCRLLHHGLLLHHRLLMHLLLLRLHKGLLLSGGHTSGDGLTAFHGLGHCILLL